MPSSLTPFFDTTEIGNYYTEAQANAAFAPKDGSSNYMPAGTMVLHSELLGPDKTSTTYVDLLFKEVFVPVAGTVTMTVWGQCDGTAAQVVMLVKAGATVRDGEHPDGYCIESASAHSPGQLAVTLQARLIAGGGLVNDEIHLRKGALVVTFTPD